MNSNGISLQVKVLKNLYFNVVIALIIFCLMCVAVAQRATIQPNIILIVADDLGYGDLSFTGSTTLTPNIDRLFEEGVSFNQAYANSPLCTPSRVALLTGQYQQRTSIDRNILFYERDIGLNTDTVLISEVLKEADYNTAIIGKWHLGFTAESHPNNQGFDEFVGLISGSANYYSHKNLGIHDLWKNNQEFYDDRYSTDLFTDEAISFIANQDDKPFFLYLPYTTPHTPFQSPQHRGAVAYKGKNTAPIAATIYQQMIQNFDENIGKLTRYLEDNDLNKNTIIVFTSDHGGIPSIADNAGLLGGKSNLTEGGLRVPLAIYGPDVLPSGKVVQEQVALMDLLPTFMDFANINSVNINSVNINSANISSDRSLTIDGLSLYELIFEEGFVQHHDALYFMSYGVKVMIEDNWKYFALPDGSEYLFDIADEETNLADAFPERLRAMAEAHSDWQKDVTAGVEQLPDGRGYGQQAVWATKVLEESVKAEATNFLTWLVRGVFEQRNGNFDKALSSYGVGLELNPESIEARMQRSSLHREQKNYSKAFADLNWIWQNYQGDSVQLKNTTKKELCKLVDFVDELPVKCSDANH